MAFVAGLIAVFFAIALRRFDQSPALGGMTTPVQSTMLVALWVTSTFEAPALRIGFEVSEAAPDRPWV